MAGHGRIAEAIYLAFSGKRSQAPVVKAGDPDSEKALEAARTRLLHIVDRVGGGEFPAQPHDEIICDFCAYPPCAGRTTCND